MFEEIKVSNPKVESVYFNDGCVRSREYVYISAKLHSIDPNKHDFSRMYFYKSGQWGRHDLEWNVNSVCYFDEQDALYALSVQGDISIATQQGFRTEKIPGAGTYEGFASIKQIRQIGKKLYVCGDQGQVYRLDKSGWVHFDNGLLDQKISASALDFNSIDGCCEDDLYAVGYHGRIFHYNEQGWTELESPTNAHIECIRCINSDEFYFCGNNGLFFKATKSGFYDFSLEGLKEHFWGLEYFQGKVYLATLSKLYVFDGASVKPITTGLEPNIGGYKLAARDDMLWSFGVNDLAFFDGKVWNRLKHPDNP
jgi:hypothetical protein